jgi:hypothetical protein
MSQDVISFHGEHFHLADQVGLMPLMRFAKIAQDGVDSDDLAGLTAMYDLLQQCIVDEEWARFEVLATRHRDQGDELMQVVKQAIETMSARPTQRSSDSSDGPAPTSQSSTAGSSSPVVRRLERQGRAAQALIVQEAEAARAARAS